MRPIDVAWINGEIRMGRKVTCECGRILYAGVKI
jgi:hypothetical protein